MYLKFLTVAITSLTLAACGGGGGSSSGSTDDPATSTGDLNLENVQKLLDTNADIAFAAYSDSVDTAVALETAIDIFVDDPTQENLDAAKLAWLVSREPYGQTEVYRFRLSPIDSTNYADEDGPEGDINAWPLGEALIDYVVEGNDFGAAELNAEENSIGLDSPPENIISSDVTIDASLIANTATAGDEHDVIAGYHAIEFMLWGQDLNIEGDGLTADTLNAREMSTTGSVLNSGGHRPLTDFTTADNADRRLIYMQVVVEKLIADLTTVRDSWEEGASYREEFTDISGDESVALVKLSEILTGMGTLSQGELAGERMQISFSSGSQEDEHSCFSDNTHRDIWLNAEGVANSYYGDYAGYDSTLDGSDDNVTRAVSGYGFDDYIADSESTDLIALAASLDEALEATEEGYVDIDASARNGIPVDNLIMDEYRDESNPMFSTILSLTAQSVVIADVAGALGISSSVVDEEASSCNTEIPDATCG